MATYLELFSLRNNSDMQDRVSVAVVKKAQAIIVASTPTAAEIAWASDAIEGPKTKMQGLLNYVLAANSNASVAEIISATDATLQGQVDTAVDALVLGGA